MLIVVCMNARLIQIIRLLGQYPSSPSEIADRLGLSPVTARRHVQRLREKGYWIELDGSGRYFLLGRGCVSGSGEVAGLGYREKMKEIEEDMEKAAYQYVLEGTVSGMMGRRDEKGAWISRFTPEDVASHLGVDVDVAERVLLKLEKSRYVTSHGRPPVYSPSEGWAFHAFRRGLVDYDEGSFEKLISKKQFTWPEGVGVSLAACREEELPDGKTRLEIYSVTGLEVIKDLAEGYLGLAFDAQSDASTESVVRIPEIPDIGPESELEPESNMLAKFLMEYRPYNPWPWLWLMDLREDMPEEEWKDARALFWSRAIRFLLLLLRPVYSSLQEKGLEGCVEMTEKKMQTKGRLKPHGRATDVEILRKSLEVMGAKRFWEHCRALCLELLRSCLRVCDTLGVSDEATQEARGIVGVLEDQQRSAKIGRTLQVS